MIITKLQGGLGNQLFQYAVGRHVAHLLNVPLVFDTSSLGKEESHVARRNFKLSAFNIDARVATRLESFIYTSHWLRLPSGTTYLSEKGYRFDPTILKTPDNTYLNGFWQSYKYVEPIRNVVLKETTLRDPLHNFYQEFTQRIRTMSSVGVHIRRQDYVTDPVTNTFHGSLPLTYYQDAATILETRGVKNATYVIFSDDIPWCREHLRLDGITLFCDPPTPIDTEELITMSNCEHFIIANSSFSWWGAWLSNNPNKIVIAPKRWTNDPKDPNERVLPNWVTL